MEIWWLVFWEKIKYSQGLACIKAATLCLGSLKVSYSLNPQHAIGFINPEDVKRLISILCFGPPTII